MDHLAAGIDTTGDGLCFLMHHLSLPRADCERIQRRLHEELAQHPAAGDPHALDDLPYLDAVVRETLRVHPPTSMLNRTCTQDAVLPLEFPVRATTGEEVPVHFRDYTGNAIGRCVFFLCLCSGVLMQDV